MAILSATFELIDKMSDKFDKMANSGEKAMDQWERAGEIGDSAFEDTAKAATQTAKAMDTASQSTDYWTDKIGHYDKSAMEAIYSTEELVEMGYKTEEALAAAAKAAEDAADANDKLSKEQEELGNEYDKTTDKSKKYNDETDKSKKSTEELGDILATVGIAKLLNEIASATMECVESFQEYQTSVAKVNTLADTSVKSIDDISSEVMSLSDDVGQASSDIAEATYQAISAGVNTANSVDFVRQANELAVGGFTSATTAVDVLTTALNSYGLETSKASQIADYLITTQNLGKTTVDELANSVGKVIPIAAAYGVEMDNLSTAYAVLTANGIATAETGTYLKAMLNELGDSGSAVTAVLINETGMSFAQLTEQGYSLGDVMAILGDSVNNNAGAFNELWSSSEAGIGALSIMNSGAERYNSVLNSMETSTGAASAAFDKMAETSAFAEQKMVNSAKNLRIAIGEDLAKSLEGIYSIGAGILGGLTTVVQKCPAVTAVVVGLTGGVATLTVAVTAHSLAVKYATQIHAAWNAVKLADPIYFITAGIVAATTALVVFASNIETTANEYDRLTASSKNQYDAIEKLKGEYEKACDVYGEHSQQAIALQGELQNLQSEYERTKQTVEEFNQELENISEQIENNAQSYDEAISKIEDEGSEIFALTSRLERLATANDGSNTAQTEMLAIIEALNDELPGLNLNMEDVINNTGGLIEAIEARAMAEINAQKAEEAFTNYKERLNTQLEAENALETAKANQTAAQERLNAAMNNERYKTYLETVDRIKSITSDPRAFQGLTTAYRDEIDAVTKAENALASATAETEKAQTVYDEAAAAADEMRNQFMELSGVSIETADSMNTVNGVIESSVSQIQQLAKAYDEAYSSALASFEGQFSLFDKAEADATATVANMQSALDSQLNYWETYASNISVLKGISAEDLGITQQNYDALMEYVQTGTEEAAGLAQSMANAVNSGNTEAIAKLAGTIGQIQVARQAAAGEVAAWKTDFDNKMDEIVKKMETAMGNLDMSTEATTAAGNTMRTYAQSILTNGAAAVSNAQSIAAQIKSALESASATVNIGVAGGGKTGTGYAAGTDFATPGWHLVGENGPEIVEFAGGETVYPADETASMLASMRPAPLNTNVPESLTGQKTEDVATKDKRIVVAIEGGGEINVKGDVSKETVVELLVSNLKPVLLDMIQEEVFEEGDGSYEY